MLLAACAVLTLGVAAALGWPLWRNGAARTAARSAYDLNVYRAQLDDLARDLERGVIAADEAHLLRLEIERRILRADTGGEAAAIIAPSGRHRGTLAVVAVVLLLIPAMIYTLLGSPRLPDQPFSARAKQIEQMQGQVAKLRDMVDQLAAKLQINPNDGPGWAMMGRSLRILHQPDRAKSALQRAMALMPDDIQTRLEYGAVLIEDLPAGAHLPEEFVLVMRDVLARDPDVPEALYFVGLAESEAGNTDKARALWKLLLDKIPAESPDRAELQKQIDELK